MKKIGFMIVPVLVIIFSGMMVPKLLASNVSAPTLVLISIATVVILSLFRPKKGPGKSVQQIMDDVYDDYCRDAFADNADLEKKFQAALKDISQNIPRTAQGKLQKMTPLCTSDRQKYAVAQASALACRMERDWKNAIREYNKAIILNPTDALAYNIGECYQRMGNLDKAKDSYEFAMELNPESARYPSSFATACVGDGDYDTAMDYARDALTLDSNYAQALATMAICYALKDDEPMYRHYTVKAAEAGYKQDKIEATVKALKKR